MDPSAVTAHVSDGDAAEQAEDGAPPQPAEAKPAAKRREETIEIQGYGKVPTAEVATYFDPQCSRRCDSGSRKAGRPFMGRVVWIRELCDCAVQGYRAAHPLEEEPGPIVAGPVAQAAAAGVARCAPAANPRGEQVRRLRARIDELREQARVIAEDVGARLAPLLDAVAAASAASKDARVRHDEVGAKLSNVKEQIAWLLERERELSRQLVETEAASTAAALALAEQQGRADAIRSSRAREERHISKQIERVERRIESIVIRHPEAAHG